MINNNSDPSFLFYDYETTGIDPKYDRVIQFAGIRTDLDFNIISEPIAIYSKLSVDIIPSIEALLVTKIYPDDLLSKGLDEPDFIVKIAQEFMRPNTCVAGYNNIRFDDEFTRYSFYRNFIDPYEREWKNNNSRWDLIDVIRMCSALRPDGINWPDNYKLEELTKANGLDHYKAHDALSDVYATIELAKLIKNRQPRLLDYLLKLRKKDFVNKLFNIEYIFDSSADLSSKLLVHSSGMIKSEYHATSLFLPLLRDPSNNNVVVAWDLRHDPELLINLESVQQAESLLYSSNSDARLNLKAISINKCPALAPISTMDKDSYQRTHLDYDQIINNANKIINNRYINNKDYNWYNIISELFATKSDFYDNNNKDPEAMLYDKFISNTDKLLCRRVQLNNNLKDLQDSFNDPRLMELMFRYRARNFPDELSDNEQSRWQEYLDARLNNNSAVYPQSLNDFHKKAKVFLADNESSTQDKELITSWLDYFNNIHINLSPSVSGTKGDN